MGHDHAHAHAAGGDRPDQRRRLGAVLVLVVLYMGAEVAGGIASGSLALLADAGHMLSDAAALALALVAVALATRPSSARQTFGWYRVEILAALVNGVVLGVIAIGICWEAIERLGRPRPVQGELMLGIAAGGLVINLLGLWILSAGRDANLNLRGAWLHVLSDALGSVGAMISGGLILAFGWTWADPAASILIALLVIHSAWLLLRETVGVLMMAAPQHLDVEAIQAALCEVPGVSAVHDLHVWTITSGLDNLSGHVVAAPDQSYPELLTTVRDLLHERFGIDHVTIQIEPEGFEEQATPV